MAWKRTASAIVSKKDVEFDEWMDALRSQHEGAVPKDHVGRIAKQVLRKCDPKKYLLSHATIVASVDTYAPRGVKVGQSMSRGVQIDVRFPDFRIAPECHDIVNNNGDAWSRPLLLSTYRTFIGSPNYVEHIQIPELSKGFIVDAIARDLGRTCYVDILVATDRQHVVLVQDILAGKIDSMSMGCISQFTICTKCGNVAADDSQLCVCVAAEGKGNKYLDEDGREHAISELVGHVSIPNSNQFIEASWVRNPAFKGAVRRNILNPDSNSVAARIEQASRVYEIRREIPELDGVKKAASVRTAEQDAAPDPSDTEPSESQSQGDDLSNALPDQGDASQDSSHGGSQSSSPSDSGSGSSDKSTDEMVDMIQKRVMDLVLKNLDEKLAPKPEDVVTVSPAPGGPSMDNDNLVRSSDEFGRAVRRTFKSNPEIVRWAIRAHSACLKGVRGVKSAGLNPRDLVILSWIVDRVMAREMPASLYKVAMSVGPSSAFPSERSYLTACSMRLGSQLTDNEKFFFLRTGRTASVAR
jgi:hypothetical protein